MARPSRIRCLLVAATIVLGTPSVSTLAAEETSWVSRSGYFRVGFTSELDPLTINEIHRWVLHLETSEGDPVTSAAITIDGGMPAHDHGLPTRPQQTRNLGGGDFLIEGMRFHMNGLWEITITIETDLRRDEVVISLEL